MKKRLMVIVAIISMLAVLAPFMPKQVKAVDTVIEDFTGWTDTSKLINAQAPAVGSELVTDAGRGNTLKLTVTGNSIDLFSPANKAWSGGVGLQVWVRNLSSDPLNLGLAFEARDAVTDNGIDLWRPMDGTKANMIVDGNVTRSDITAACIVLPGNYEGFVQIPFSAFAGVWYGGTTPDLSTVGNIWLLFSAADNEKVLLFDDITLLAELAELTTTPPATSTPTTDPTSTPTTDPTITPTTDPTTAPENTGSVIEDFTGWTDTSKLVNAQAPAVGSELVADAGRGSTLKLTVTGDSIDLFSPANKAWSGAAGIQVWVKNLSSDPLNLGLAFEARDAVTDNGIDLWRPMDGTKVNMIVDGSITQSDITAACIVLPGNYEGFVQIPFSAFAGVWYGGTTPDLSTVGNIWLLFSAADNEKVLLFDDITLLDKLSSPDDSSSVKTSDADMNLLSSLLIVSVSILGFVVVLKKKSSASFHNR